MFDTSQGFIPTFPASSLNTPMTDLYPTEIPNLLSGDEDKTDWPAKGTPEYTERWRQSMRQLAEFGVPIPESWFTKTSHS